MNSMRFAALRIIHNYWWEASGGIQQTLSAWHWLC